MQTAGIGRQKSGNSLRIARPGRRGPMENLTAESPRTDDQNPTKISGRTHGRRGRLEAGSFAEMPSAARRACRRDTQITPHKRVFRSRHSVPLGAVQPCERFRINCPDSNIADSRWRRSDFTGIFGSDGFMNLPRIVGVRGCRGGGDPRDLDEPARTPSTPLLGLIQIKIP